MNILTKPTLLANLMIEQYCHEGDIALDCTVGNGVDTLYLRQLVGKTGKVYGFDVQQQAIDNTHAYLKNAQIDIENVTLIKDTHANIEKYIHDELAVCVFNLGYLPNGDKSITTLTQSTIKAIESCIRLLKKDGLILIVAYPGHDEGLSEASSVIDYTNRLSSKEYHVVNIKMTNQSDRAPLIIMITKKK